MSKRDDVLDAALRLFNAQGTSEISTNHMASEAQISPGNLYYHFRHKQAVIAALAEQMFARWKSELTLPVDQLPQIADVATLLRRSFEIAWDYRFFYRELVALLRQDPDLAVRFQTERQRGLGDFRELFGLFVAQGLFKPLAPRSLDLLATNIWLINDFWLLQAELDPTLTTPDQLVDRGIELVLHTLDPYLI